MLCDAFGNCLRNSRVVYICSTVESDSQHFYLCSHARGGSLAANFDTRSVKRRRGGVSRNGPRGSGLSDPPTVPQKTDHIFVG